MALGTLTKITAYKDANKRVTVYDIILGTGANYPTGGETIAAATVGLRKIEGAAPLGVALATTGGATSRTVGFQYGNGTTTTKMLIHTTASTEAANASDQSAYTQRIRFSGT